MRYILDDKGYVKYCSNTQMTCENKSCTEYKGSVPSGYATIEEWAVNANIRAYKIVSGNLTYDSAKDAELQKEYQQYETNEIIITSTNTPPSPDGKWKLFDKEFASLIEVSEDGTYFTNGSINSCTIGIARRGHSIYTRFKFVNSVDLNDSEVNIGSLNLSALGVNNLSFSKYQNGHTDGGQGMFMAQLSDTGVLNVVDVVGKTENNTIPANSTCYVEFTHIVALSRMSDEECDKFYWKRTA